VERTPPPLLGFNNNVRHRGRVFHIQTEDSGIRHARIVTHLFADGGRIVRTKRTDYSEVVGRQDASEVLRRMMKEQHKSMFMALRAGELDALIDEVFGAKPEPDSGADTPTAFSPALDSKAHAPESASLASAGLSGRSSQQPSAAQQASPAAPSNSPLPQGGRPDVTLQRVVSIGEPSPTPASVTAATAASVESALGSAEEPEQRDTQVGVGTGSETAAGTRKRADSVPHAAQREGPSIFGDTTSNGQSLDNVILSYLAEGVEEETPQD
jgi:hypothetical protein